MLCSKCGAQVPEGNKFCTACGSPMDPQQQQQYQQPQQQYQQPQQQYQQPQQQYQQPQYGGYNQPPKKGKGPIIAIIIVVALIAIGVAVFFIVRGMNNNGKQLSETEKQQIASRVDSMLSQAQAQAQAQAQSQAPDQSQAQSQAQSQTPPNWLSNQSQAQSSASSSQRQVIYNQTPEIGKTVKFGAYEQDNNLSNGPEPIEWIIVERFEDNSYVLLSVYGLDQVDYDTKEKVTAKDSYIYKWMNNDFYNEAFNDEEKAFMDAYDYFVERNSTKKTLIETKVGLLAPNLLKKYLKDDNARKAKATEYAKAKGAEVQDGQCWYWLCPTADLKNDVLYDTHAACVNYDGSIMEKISTYKSAGGAVRPIIVVYLEKMIQQ